MEPTAAQERAGKVGIELATGLAAKIRDVITGFPADSPEQRSAIASLICEDLENYANEDLGT
jgi:hypothetical protein